MLSSVVKETCILRYCAYHPRHYRSEPVAVYMDYRPPVRMREEELVFHPDFDFLCPEKMFSDIDYIVNSV